MRIYDDNKLYVKTGDILVNGDFICKVLAVCDECVLYSSYDNLDMAQKEWFTFYELKRNGWRIKETETGMLNVAGREVSVETIKAALKSYFDD